MKPGAIAGPPGPAILAFARATSPLLRSRAEEAEQLRHIPQQTIDEAAQAGFFAALVPRRWGGGEVTFREFVEASRHLARGCTSSAWTLSFLALHAWLLCRFDPKFQEELFAARPYALAPAALAPTGTARKVLGGFEVSGRWDWGTGVMHAEWVIVTALEETMPPVARFCVMPIGDVRVADVWHTAGMVATGSNSIVADRVFVPDYRTLITRSPLPSAGELLHSDSTVSYPVAATLALVACTPALGAAEAAVDGFRDRMKVKLQAYSGAKQAEQAATHLRLGEATATVRAAALLWNDAIARLERLGSSKSPHGMEELAAVRLACAGVVRMANDAINGLSAAAGASAGFLSSPLQRQLRDVQMMRGHVMFDWDRAAQVAGKVALGFETTPADLL